MDTADIVSRRLYYIILISTILFVGAVVLFIL